MADVGIKMDKFDERMLVQLGSDVLLIIYPNTCFQVVIKWEFNLLERNDLIWPSLSVDYLLWWKICKLICYRG